MTETPGKPHKKTDRSCFRQKTAEGVARINCLYEEVVRRRRETDQSVVSEAKRTVDSRYSPIDTEDPLS